MKILEDSAKAILISIPAKRARMILLISSALFIISLMLYAVIVNTMAGEEYGLKKLTLEIDRAENEIARSQALLLKGSLEGSQIAENGTHEIMMQDIGSDLHYLHANATFVEAPKPTP